MMKLAVERGGELRVLALSNHFIPVFNFSLVQLTTILQSFRLLKEMCIDMETNFLNINILFSIERVHQA